MRGKDAEDWQDGVAKRITPAYAGKRCRVTYLTTQHRDHPRLCGEKDYFEENFPKDKGSPPPMRGKGTSNIRSDKR